MLPSSRIVWHQVICSMNKCNSFDDAGNIILILYLKIEYINKNNTSWTISF